MVELKNDRIEQMLHEESVKKEEPETILRSIYIRHMRLYEKYLADLDALDDDQIAEMKAYHEETNSLIKYYYMDIPQDVCRSLRELETEYTAKLLGPEWREFLSGVYEDYKKKSKSKDKGEDYLKAEFAKEALSAFYDAMDYVFRDGFGTGSQTAKKVVNGITELLFGKKQ